jgi:polyribonucleotide nucleotidyltransferase
MKKALKWINDLTRQVEIGEKFRGKVTRLTDFGAFVQILPGQEGMVHISQLSDQRVGRIDDVLKIGDELDVVVIEIDELDRINLSHKAAVSPGHDVVTEKFGRNYRPKNDGPPRDRSGGNRRGGGRGFGGGRSGGRGGRPRSRR